MTSRATFTRRAAHATVAAADTPDMGRPAGSGGESRARTTPATRTPARKARRRTGEALCGTGTVRPAAGVPGAAQAATSPHSAMTPRRGPRPAPRARNAAAERPVPAPAAGGLARRRPASPGTPVTART